MLAQYHKVTAADVIAEKIEKINNRVSLIQDEYIEKYFAEKELKLSATLDGASAYKDAVLWLLPLIPVMKPARTYSYSSYIRCCRLNA